MSKFFTILLVLFSTTVFSQTGGVAIGPNGVPPDPSAGLDVNFSNKGFLMPRVSQADRNAISSPAAGLMIYDITTNCFEFYTGTAWQSMICACTNAPAVPGTISGITLYCANQTNVIYSIAPVATATSYTWSVPSDATIVTGQGSTSITVNFGSATGNISVFALNTCGSSAVDSLPVSSISGVPADPGFIGGANFALNNETGVAFSSSPVAGTSYYKWTVPADAVIASGQGTNNITVNFGTTPGNICVTDSNGCGSSNSQCTDITLYSSCPLHGSQTFVYTGTPQTFTVPTCSGVTSVSISAYGAQGGSAVANNFLGGQGGQAQGTLNVNGGDQLYVYVGNQPIDNTAGYNGGGAGGGDYGYGGGGASDVRVGGQDLSNRVIVAGGGGGASANYGTTGGDGGGTNGGNPIGGAGGTGSPYSGQGATQSAGGSGEQVYRYFGSQEDGSWGQGGIGGNANNSGGGGGGGYYGGGGGDAGCGGGGSGYIDGVIGGSMQTGIHNGSGQVVISW